MATPFNAVPILGAMFSAAVFTLPTKLSINVPKSASSFASPVTRLLHADFADAMLPEIVSDASFAVVPVIPISVCTTWIASTISA